MRGHLPTNFDYLQFLTITRTQEFLHFASIGMWRLPVGIERPCVQQHNAVAMKPSRLVHNVQQYSTLIATLDAHRLMPGLECVVEAGTVL